jgi:DNA repair protein RadA/Sms
MKAKVKVSFVCQECGYDSPSWLGKCPECGNWNSMREFKSPRHLSGGQGRVDKEQIKPQKLGDIAYSEKSRIRTEYNELNTVLGGGLVNGSVTLLAGDPGVGKSTFLLQLALSLTRDKRRILYVNGEESSEQVKMRATRLRPFGASTSAKAMADKTAGKEDDNLFLVSLVDTEAIVQQIEEMKPDLVVVDSIQMIESENVSGLSGSVAQVRYGALQFVRCAKQTSIPIIIVGHVTKEGQVAGPMILSHMVDTVLFFEGERFTQTRILRSLKNRFGPVDEVGIFLMGESGMQEASNPEQLFMGGRIAEPGSVLVVTLEGSRVFLVEVQALVVRSGLPMPRRVVSGMDQRRVELLLAVLQKHCRVPLETMDVFVNVAGGLKLSDPGADLGICLAVFSSFSNVSLDSVVGVAEVGLLGELRSIPGLDKRIREAEKLGFSRIMTAKKHKTLKGVIGELSGKKN